MSYIISVYTKKAFRDFNLPVLDNSDYRIVLAGKEFSLPENIAVDLEVLDGNWKFVKSESYSIIKDGRSYFNVSIKNGDLLRIITNSGIRLSVVITETNENFPVFTKYKVNNDTLTIGSGRLNSIRYDNLGLVSKLHANLFFSNGKCYVEGMGINGVFVGYNRIYERTELKYGECINIFGLKILYLNNVLAVVSYDNDFSVNAQDLRKVSPSISRITKHPEHIEISQSGYETLFHRSPRSVLKLNDEEIEIESPPAMQQKEKRPLLLTIGPSLTMALPMVFGCMLAISAMNAQQGAVSPFMYTGIVTAVSSALIGVIWALVNIRYANKASRDAEMYRVDAYGAYLRKIGDELASLYDENYKIMHKMYPATDACCAFNVNTSELWNRNITHKDFLSVRVGLGDVPFQVKIKVPKQKFSLVNDKLVSEPQKIAESFAKLKGVPICVDLVKRKLVGVVGKNGRCIRIARNIVCQIAANNCYTDVKIIFLHNGKKDAEPWNFIKWFPHTWSNDRKMRYVAIDENEKGDVMYELSAKLRSRIENKKDINSSKIEIPYYVIVADSPELLEADMVSKYILNEEVDCGVSAVILADTCDDLPNQCNYIIQNDEEFCGLYDLQSDVNERIKVKFDKINPLAADEFARRISDIRVSQVESGGGLPNGLDFFEMYNVSSIEEFKVYERWRKSKTYDSMKALVGVKAGGAKCYLDIHEKYHGPHGLVAGTTGSGKSETLQTYILSLAIEYSPIDVAFLIIDFKGGGMANLFSDLPHLAGKITNLSGNQIYRAMVSIKSECKRRQRLFGQFGVNNINAYTRLLKNNDAETPVPHLIIIIDEFAELKREEPDFMRELISVAQIGRSLGVHLILATQKPSGTVDDNIWSNSKFKLCLRVQDRQDSNDMLHRPDAAYITQAGRCYLQVGNDEIFELFQSGYSGGEYDESEIGKENSIATMIDTTGRAALVGNRTKIRNKAARKIEWLIELSKIIGETVKKGGQATVDAIKNPSASLDSLINDVFENIETHRFDYPRSVYNGSRLESYIRFWYLETGDVEFVDPEHVKRVYNRASATGKKLPEVKEKSELDAIVEYLKKVAKENGFENNVELWLPALSNNITLTEIEGYGNEKGEEPGIGNWSIETIVGLCDDPVNQAQYPLNINISRDGHHVICGTVVSGKSTFMQTLIFSLISKYTAEYINIYALDFSNKMLSVFEPLPHVGGIMYENDKEKISKFFTMLNKDIDERKKILKSGSYAQYVMANGVKIPAILIFIDNYAAFREKTGDAYDREIMTLARDGAAYGIFLIISAGGFGSSELPNRIADYIKKVVCLEMGDKYRYGEVLHSLKFDVLPEAGVKGRGITEVEGTFLEFQTALIERTTDDYERNRHITEICEEISKNWMGHRARSIPVIPEKPVWSGMQKNEEFMQSLREECRLPFGYDMQDASVGYVDLSRTFSYLLTGRSRTGKSNTFKVMLASALLKKVDITVIDMQNKLTDQFEGSMRRITEYKDLYDFWKDMVPEFAERNKFKRQLVSKGYTEDEIYVKMEKYPQKFIFITDLAEYVKSLYNLENVKEGDMRGFMENITEKGRGHKIVFISELDLDSVNQMVANKTFSNLLNDAGGVLHGGNPVGQRVFDFSVLPFAEQSKVMRPGVVYVAPEVGDTMVKKYAIPMFGR